MSKQDKCLSVREHYMMHCKGPGACKLKNIVDSSGGTGRRRPVLPVKVQAWEFAGQSNTSSTCDEDT